MRKSRFPEEQIIKVLKEHAAGRRLLLCCRRSKGHWLRGSVMRLERP